MTILVAIIRHGIVQRKCELGRLKSVDCEQVIQAPPRLRLVYDRISTCKVVINKEAMPLYQCDTSYLSAAEGGTPSVLEEPPDLVWVR